jgi:hypothetical protein
VTEIHKMKDATMCCRHTEPPLDVVGKCSRMSAYTLSLLCINGRERMCVILRKYVKQNHASQMSLVTRTFLVLIIYVHIRYMCIYLS